jgi:hypothetical protein
LAFQICWCDNVVSNVADPAFHFDADPDPTFDFDADLDTAFHFDADPDPAIP